MENILFWYRYHSTIIRLCLQVIEFHLTVKNDCMLSVITFHKHLAIAMMSKNEKQVQLNGIAEIKELKLEILI